MEGLQPAVLQEGLASFPGVKRRFTIEEKNGNELTNTVNAMISGVSGIGHILTGIGLLLFLFILKASVKDA